MKKVTNLRDQFFTVPHFDILRSEQVFKDKQKILKFPAKILQNDTAFFRVFQNQIDSCIFSTLTQHVCSQPPDKPKLIGYAMKLDLASLARLASLRALRYKIVGIQSNLNINTWFYFL